VNFHCYNRMPCGLRFRFQGSGYSEAFNSFYQRHIVNKKVPLEDLPQKLQKQSADLQLK